MAFGRIEIAASVVDTNPITKELTGNTGLIRYYSNAFCEMVVYSTHPIDENLYIIRNGNSTIYGSSGTFNNVESSTFTFSAEDAKGNVGTETLDIPTIPYVKLTCNLKNNKPDANGNMDVVCTGSYFSGSFGAVDNTLDVQYRYKKQGGNFGDWQTMSIYTGGGIYSATASIVIPDFDYKAVYTFECKAADKLSTISATALSVKSTPVFHWGEDDFQFEVPVTVNGDTRITGDLRLKGSGQYGNALRFGDEDFCYIAEEKDDIMTIFANNKINLSAKEGVYINDKQIPVNGSWTPTLNYSSAISSYTTQYGWYSKVGNIVTVGFYIKATCYSGYDSTTIAILGLPFVPLFPAAGGGMCSGAYVGAGFNFQCFVAETRGSITTRVQSCNHTSQTNLSTSASGCNYRPDGGEITLSGTITYMSST